MCDECRSNGPHCKEHGRFGAGERAEAVARLDVERVISDADLLYDALRFARDFEDENGLPWSNDERDRLEAWIDRLERLIESNAGGD